MSATFETLGLNEDSCTEQDGYGADWRARIIQTKLCPIQMMSA